MMYIFYDFETSSREFLGQILTYSFIVTDTHYQIKEECNGMVCLRRSEVPDVDAIKVTGIDINHINAHGDDEYTAAKTIFQFLERCLAQYGRLSLVGFNSNNFDLQFLRNTLIQYGLNPYFGGKIANLDLLHYAQSMAFAHPDIFPWTLAEETEERGGYYRFKLEDLAQAFDLLTAPQSHDAREDVLLTIEVAKAMENRFQSPLSDFLPVQLAEGSFYQGNMMLGKCKVRHFPEKGQLAEHFQYRYYLSLEGTQKARLVVDLEAYQQRDSNEESALLHTVRYVNFNKAFFHIEPLAGAEEEYWSTVVDEVRQDPILGRLTMNAYFEKNKRDWDIAYQIHELGFERIDQLARLVQQLQAKPDAYVETVKRLWDSRQEKKDEYLVQLYNRAYLNLHPNPSPAHLKRYWEPRYVTGALHRDKTQFEAINQQRFKCQTYLEDPEISDREKEALTSLLILQESLIAELS